MCRLTDMTDKCLTHGTVLFAGLALIALPAPAPAQCQPAKLVAPDGATDDLFAFSVATSAATVVVGTPFDDDNGSASGSARVFGHDPNGAWIEVAKLLADDGAESDQFGWSAAIAGRAVVVGAHYDDDFGTRSGSAYVFERDPNGVWSQTAKLLPDDGEEYELFGSAVGIAGDLIIVGAPHDDDNGYRSGSAYVFGRDPNGAWLQTAKLLADDGEPYDKFGSCVAIDGDVAVMGAPYDQDQGDYSGSAYVFERDADGAWSQASKLLPHDGAAFWNFGETVALNGNCALVGAPTAFAFAPAGGAAYIFERDPNGGWPEVAQIVSDDVATADSFGASVALDGDLAVVGAWGDDDHGQHSGSAYVFVRQPDGSWPQVAKLVPDEGAPDDYFGAAVAVSGHTGVIGAYLDDDQGEDSGSAYVFNVGPDEDGDGVMDVCEDSPGVPIAGPKRAASRSDGRAASEGAVAP